VKLGPTVDNNTSTATMKESRPVWLPLFTHERHNAGFFYTQINVACSKWENIVDATENRNSVQKCFGISYLEISNTDGSLMSLDNEGTEELALAGI
jgi:hypothetical protein